jgi:hypothetical protein
MVNIVRFAELENATLATVVMVPPQADVAGTSVPPSPEMEDAVMDTAENLTQQPEDTPLPLIPDVTAHGVVSPVAMETVVVESDDPGVSCSWAQATEYEDDVPVEGDGLDVDSEEVEQSAPASSASETPRKGRSRKRKAKGKRTVSAVASTSRPRSTRSTSAGKKVVKIDPILAAGPDKPPKEAFKKPRRKTWPKGLSKPKKSGVRYTNIDWNVPFAEQVCSDRMIDYLDDEP